jgi:hypothetical protein
VDEYGIQGTCTNLGVPAIAGDILVPCQVGKGVSAKEQKQFQSGVGKLLHLMRWSRPDILNAVRELSRFMKEAAPAHMKAMYRAMQYCVAMPEQGLELKPSRKWDGNRDFQFVISGASDANFATDPSTRKSVSGYAVFLEDAPVSMKSGQQRSVTLSVTEAELVAATQCAQDMLYVMHVIESMELKVKKPMILETDNKGVVDIANNWSVGGRCHHIDVRQYFLRELKESNKIRVIWKKGADMSSDMFTKNLPRPLFEKHLTKHCGEDVYMAKKQDKKEAKRGECQKEFLPPQEPDRRESPTGTGTMQDYKGCKPEPLGPRYGGKSSFSKTNGGN